MQETIKHYAIRIIFYFYPGILFLSRYYPVIVARHMMLSLKMVSSLRLTLFQAWLTETKIHTLVYVIMEMPLSKHQITLIILQEVCTHMVSLSFTPGLQLKRYWRQICIILPAAIFYIDGMFTSPALNPNFFMTWCSHHPDWRD